MILVTGGAGFIGSALIWELNNHGHGDIVVSDRLGSESKWKNLSKRHFSRFVPKESLFAWLKDGGQHMSFDAVFHLGACSATTESNVDYLMQNNFNFSVKLWQYCAEFQVPFIYASSAATYGNGHLGFDDAAAVTPNLESLNPYGFSKLKFDQMVLSEVKAPPYWIGLRFFNVYGPQEYHKGSQASVMLHFSRQIRDLKKIKLFKSNHPNFLDGQQKRDFIYIKDVTKVLYHFFKARGQKSKSGIYNLGTGTARTFEDVAKACFAASGDQKYTVEFFPMPETLTNQYQNFTQAQVTKLRELGQYQAPLTSLEDGVYDYYNKYLLSKDPYL
jgi:ADP-L-glycero-D-manno-heptose 6-epimerase